MPPVNSSSFKFNDQFISDWMVFSDVTSDELEWLRNYFADKHMIIDETQYIQKRKVTIYSDDLEY